MPKLTQTDLRQFQGDLERFRHSLNPNVIYTPGIQYLAEIGQAYWLIDAIASWIGSAEFNAAKAKDYRICDMHFWTLEVDEGNTAKLAARADSPCEPFIIQEIEFTDFPLPRVEVWAAYDGQHWTLYLPSEH
ncbi:hypothetical protein K227x_58820 [Rubripirellula lacrimiformis]|uniref:DUF6876 domain-containing protein n=1 Tax=Rubripirellula lacrimiformis TaxID=1930273 RepID=A0A517NJZ5_9BACT|nr:DUF6876 family protein [Rubripirellula lacrimiformis]QDT07455.1 hypothetical protein K227x_58820 [Rubripirellula lacrimiformis]